MQYLIRIANVFDNVSEVSGRITSWLVLMMVLIVCYDVSTGYFFLDSSIALQELEWHLFSLVFLLGGAYTLKHDGHVRVDVFYHSKWMSDSRRAWLNIIGGLLFLLPFCLLIIVSSLGFIESSFQFSERSPDPGGLPYRFLLKAVIPLAFILVLIQGLSTVIRNIPVALNKDGNNS